MSGVDLSEFLLARIAEDELWASQASPWATGSRDEGQPIAWKRHMWNWSPMRVLDECQAKRFVIDALRGYEPSDQWGIEPDIGKRANNAAGALRRLALPYADHPDYDQAWRP